MRVKAILYSPQWEGPIKGWARGCITKNKWRCDPILDNEDLLQDAYLVFLKLVDHYPSVREPRHFMALFKTALTNEMHNYARDMRGHPDTTDVGDAVEYTNWGHVAALLATAPAELRLALSVFMDETKLAELNKVVIRPRFSRRNLVPRENLNAKLARVAGFDPSLDVVTMIKALFA